MRLYGELICEMWYNCFCFIILGIVHLFGMTIISVSERYHLNVNIKTTLPILAHVTFNLMLLRIKAPVKYKLVNSEESVRYHDKPAV